MRKIDIFRPILSETTPQIIRPRPLSMAYKAMAVPAAADAAAAVRPAALSASIPKSWMQ